MLLVIDNFEQFKVFFDVIFDITEFVELQLFENHMYCSILDKAHTRFIRATFQKDFFAAYGVKDGESVVLFSEDIHKIIKSANKLDNVTLMTNDDYLICKLESENGNTRIFEFVLPTELVDSPQPPSLSLPVSLELDVNILKQGIKDLKIMGSGEIRFNVNRNNLSITSGSEIYGNYSSDVEIDTTFDENIASRFSIEYIEQLLKFEKVSKNVELSLGDNFPLLFSFNDADININGLIAPRIEEE